MTIGSYSRPATIEPTTAKPTPIAPTAETRPAPLSSFEPESPLPLPPLGPMVPPPVVGVLVPFETVLDSPDNAAKPMAVGS